RIDKHRRHPLKMEEKNNMQREAVRGYRLSPQQRLLWIYQCEHGSQFFAQCALLLEGRLNDEALHASLLRMIERHEVLRTTFNHMPGIKLPVQSIRDRREILLREFNSSGLDVEGSIDEAL